MNLRKMDQRTLQLADTVCAHFETIVMTGNGKIVTKWRSLWTVCGSARSAEIIGRCLPYANGRTEIIGIRDRSDEMLIMTTSGVYKTMNVRTMNVRRRPELERLDFEFLVTLNGTPWNPNPAAGEMAADALPTDMAVSMPAPVPVPQIAVAAAPVDRAASRAFIKNADVQKFGYSINCFGCRLVMTNTTARAHTEECHKRLESCLAEDEETQIGSSKVSCW